MNEALKPKTKRQHYIPIFLLNSFCKSNGRLLVFDKKSGKEFETLPKEICYEDYLYEKMLIENHFFSANKIENEFAKLEYKWSVLIRQIIERCDNPNNRNAFIANQVEKKCLAELFYNLFTRNPLNLELMNRSFEKIGLHEELHILSKHGIGDDSSLCKSFDLSIAFEDAAFKNEFCNHLLKSYFYVGFVAEEHFLTSNYPFLLSDKGHLFAFLPISPKYALIWLPQKMKSQSNTLLSLSKNVPKKLEEHYKRFSSVRFIIK